MLARVALTDDFSRGGTNKRISLIILRSGTSKRGASPHFFDYFFVARRHKKSERVRIFTEFFFLWLGYKESGVNCPHALFCSSVFFVVQHIFLFSPDYCRLQRDSDRPGGNYFFRVLQSRHVRPKRRRRSSSPNLTR